MAFNILIRMYIFKFFTIYFFNYTVINREGGRAMNWNIESLDRDESCVTNESRLVCCEIFKPSAVGCSGRLLLAIE